MFKHPADVFCLKDVMVWKYDVMLPDSSGKAQHVNQHKEIKIPFTSVLFSYLWHNLNSCTTFD